MKGAKDFYNISALAYIEQRGGQLKMLAQIEADRAAGNLTSKQAFDLKKVINRICALANEGAAQNDAIKELDKKMKEAARYFR